MSGGRFVRERAAEIASVEDLSRKYRSVLLRYFARQRIAANDAQDLAQEVFLRLSRHDALEGVVRPDAYLFATAANMAVEHWRRRSVRTAHPPESFYEAVQITEIFPPDRTAEGRQELALILAALNEMPERMRNIFILARLENMPRAEIASRIGVSKSLVEQQITTATACLAARRRQLS